MELLLLAHEYCVFASLSSSITQTGLTMAWRWGGGGGGRRGGGGGDWCNIQMELLLLSDEYCVFAPVCPAQ